MSIKLLYITKDPTIGVIAQQSGVDWIFVDMEYRGKRDRQSNRDTVISAHSIADVRAMRKVINNSQLLVRINPIDIHSSVEIKEVVNAGADIVMLPFFKTKKEVQIFISKVAGRAKTCLLVETLEAIEILDEILAIKGIDYMYIGLNDIHIARKTTFMFEFLADGGVDQIAAKLRKAAMDFGFGGMSRIGELIPPAECILGEHYRLGSSAVILARSFCPLSQANGSKEFTAMFKSGVDAIREQEVWLAKQPPEFFEANRQLVKKGVYQVVHQMKGDKS